MKPLTTYQVIRYSKILRRIYKIDLAMAARILSKVQEKRWVLRNPIELEPSWHTYANEAADIEIMQDKSGDYYDSHDCPQE